MAFWTTAPSKLKVKKLKEEGCLVSLSVEVPPEHYTEAEQNALVQIQAKAALPGFRTGKAPIQMIQKNFSAQIKEKAFDNIVHAILPEVIKEQGLAPVSLPLIKDFNCAENKACVFTIDIDCAPKFTPQKYTKAALSKKPSAVTQQDVEKQINQLLGQNARLEPADETESVNSGHFVVVDYEAFSEGKPSTTAMAGNPSPEGSPATTAPAGRGRGELVDMSAPQTIAGLADNILGAKKGEMREFDSEAAGRKLRIKVTVNELKRKIVPALDEAFVKDMGFESVDKFRDHLKQIMEADYAEKSEKDIVRQLEDHLLKENPFPVPQSLVDAHLASAAERIKGRLVEEEKAAWNDSREAMLKERLKPAVERDVRLGYLLRSIAQKENIKAGPQEFEHELERSMGRLQNDAQKKQIREVFENRRDDILSALTEKKVIDFLKSQSVINEQK